jgi:hypothetical protein
VSDFNETLILSTDFLKIPKIKFHENRSSGSRVVLCRRTDRQTDMTKLIAAFRNFANALKNNIEDYSRVRKCQRSATAV